MPKFIYVMDPMCSWCWAFSSTVTALHKHYPEFNWQLVMGGLAPDSDVPMPVEMQEKISSIWRHIEQRTNTPFNHDFWAQNTPRRSTYPACRAVISAEQISNGSGFEMIDAIQKAYYLKAKNPSDNEILETLAASMDLPEERFKETLNSLDTEKRLEQDLQLAAHLGAQGFPSLFLETEQQIYAVSYGYSSTEEIMNRVGRILEGE